MFFHILYGTYPPIFLVFLIYLLNSMIMMKQRVSIYCRGSSVPSIYMAFVGEVVLSAFIEYLFDKLTCSSLPVKTKSLLTSTSGRIEC